MRSSSNRSHKYARLATDQDHPSLDPQDDSDSDTTALLASGSNMKRTASDGEQSLKKHSPEPDLPKLVSDPSRQNPNSKLRSYASRYTYSGAILFNALTFILPALYGTLSKLWIAQIDSSMVATTDSYTYITVVAETLNEGLPRAAFLIIGDRNRTLPNRLNLCFTLIAFQILAGLVMSLAFVGAAPQFAAAFVPADIREASITYVRISAFVALTSASDVAVSYATRAMDKPDVPLIISLSAITVNIVFDFMFLSNFRIKGLPMPTVNTQAAIRLACNATGSMSGLIYFFWTAKRVAREDGIQLKGSVKPTVSAWWTLARPGASTFVESAIRNAFYLWLIHGIVALGNEYATAWGVFNTIRWGIVMVPVQALEATAATFAGHAWNDWRLRALHSGNHRATWMDIVGPLRLQSPEGIAKPAIRSACIALLVEIPLFFAFSFGLAKPFARWLSGSDGVARITARMWRTIDWCYICYAVNTQLASLLLATKPRWYLVNSLTVNLLWVLPWAIALQVGITITASTAWTYHAIIFGGSLVLSFIVTWIVLGVWTWKMLRGKMNLSEGRIEED